MLVEFSSDWQQRRKGFQLNYLTFFAGTPNSVCVEGAKTNLPFPPITIIQYALSV